MQHIFAAGLAIQGGLPLVSDQDAVERIHVALDLLDEALETLRLATLRIRS